MAETSMERSKNDIETLKEVLRSQQQLLAKLYNELDVEREASATAASEALSMILRLQGEKAAVKMEAEQYKRYAEEKICHAEESLVIFEDLIYQKEMELVALDHQVQAYRYKLLSMGCSDNGIGDIKFPDNLLQKNETLFRDVAAQNLSRRNSAPPAALKSYLKGIIERDRSRSGSPDSDLLPEIEEVTDQEIDAHYSNVEDKTDNYVPGDINSYWEQIRKLDERVKEITGYNCVNLRRESRLPSLHVQGNAGTSSAAAQETAEEFDHGKHPENSLAYQEATESSCSLSVHDVFEVPQTHEKCKGLDLQTKDEERTVLKGDERLGKPDAGNVEAIKSYVKDETDKVKKMLLSVCQNNLCRPSNGVAVDCHCALVQPTIGVVQSQSKNQPVIGTSEITEVERQDGRQETINRNEEELRLLNEIRNQLNSIQSEIKSLKIKKSSRQDDFALLSLKEAMLHFWL